MAKNAIQAMGRITRLPGEGAYGPAMEGSVIKTSNTAAATVPATTKICTCPPVVATGSANGKKRKVNCQDEPQKHDINIVGSAAM
jgi:hypothetical protein